MRRLPVTTLRRSLFAQLLGGLTCVVFGVPSAARAAEPARRIVLQAYAERIPEDGVHYVSYLLRTLGDLAPLHGDALRSALEEQVSRDAGESSPVDDLREMVAAGRQQFIEGQYAAAAKTLERARQGLVERQALVAIDQTLREPLHRATLFLAHAYLRLGEKTQAAELVGEAMRSFPDRELSLVHHGPDLVGLYREVRAALGTSEPGGLLVTTVPTGCMVFVNERYVGLAPARLAGLLPGRYRVFIQRPGTPGRLHWVQVGAGESTLALDHRLDRALRTTPEVLLLYPSQEALAAQSRPHVLELGRKLQVDEVLLLGLGTYQGRRVIEGTLLSVASGAVLRSAMLALEPVPAPATIKGLGRYLLTGERGVPLLARDQAQPTRRASAGPWRWIALGLGLATLAAGIPLIAIHDTGTCSDTNCPENYDTIAPGLGLTIAGGALIVSSAVLFTLHALRENAPAENAKPPARAASGTVSWWTPWVATSAVGMSGGTVF